jgi:hypothetical protein
MFLSKGKKEWEGDSQSLFYNDVKPLQEFLMASKMMQGIMQKRSTLADNNTIATSSCLPSF